MNCKLGYVLLTISNLLRSFPGTNLFKFIYDVVSDVEIFLE